MPPNTETHTGETGSTVNNYNTIPVKGWRENAVLITLTLNIVALLAVVFGGMNWVTEVNTSLSRIATNQTAVRQAVKEMREFDIRVVERPAGEDAVEKLKAQNKNVR